jgi:hypothetical protein
MSDVKCAHCGAGMHRLTRWCQKCGKSAGNPVIPITYPKEPIPTSSKSGTTAPTFTIPQAAPAPTSFAPAPPPPTPKESVNAFNFLPQSMQPAAKPSDAPNSSGVFSQFKQPAPESSESISAFNFLPPSAQPPAKPREESNSSGFFSQFKQPSPESSGIRSAFNFLPQSMQPEQNSSASTNGYQVPEYAAADHTTAGDVHQYDSSGVWREGNILVATKDATFPNRCLKCNNTTEWDRINKKLYWHNPAWFLILLVFSPLVYLLVALSVRKTATVQIPLCTKHRENRKMTTMIGGSIFGLGLIMIIPSFMFDTGAGILLSVLALLAGGIVCAIGRRLVTPTKIDNEYVWMKGACKEFLQDLPSV